MDKTSNEWHVLNDMALLKILGVFVKHHRLEQNKTQDQLAKEAGINRSTLSEFEQGKRSNTLTLIQLLRSLGQLHVLESFKISPQVSPIQLARLEQNKRKRANRKKGKDDDEHLYDW